MLIFLPIHRPAKISPCNRTATNSAQDPLAKIKKSVLPSSATPRCLTVFFPTLGFRHSKLPPGPWPVRCLLRLASTPSELSTYHINCLVRALGAKWFPYWVKRDILAKLFSAKPWIVCVAAPGIWALPSIRSARWEAGTPPATIP